MTIAQPFWLFALLGVAVLALILVWASRRSLTRWRAVFSAVLLERVAPARVLRRRRVRRALALVGLALTVLALAEPRYGKGIQTLTGKGADVVVVLDLSRSMAAQDVEPSRMERARREIFDLLDLVEGDRIGLVVYAGGAIPRMPLTVDHVALKQLIQELSPRTFVAQGSALDAGLRSALGMLQEDDTQRGGQAILVLSDGEVHRPEDALAAAREVADAGVVIYTMGIGRVPAPIPDGKRGFVQDRGEVVLSDPDPVALREVARVTGGAYVDSVASSQDIEQLYMQEMRRNLQAVERMTVQREVWNSGYSWPLSFGFACLLCSAWLGDGRRHLAPALLAVSLAGVFASSPAQAAPAEELAQADRLYRADRFDEAARELTDLMLEWPGDPDVLDRLGAARYRAGDYDGAARAWDEAAQLQGEGSASSLFNSANAHYQAGRLEESVRRYEELLETDPSHRGATNNRDVVSAEIERRRQMQPPPPPPPQEGEGEDSESDGEQEPSDPQEGEQDGDAQGDASNEPSEPSQDGQTGEPQEANPSEGSPEDPSEGSEGADPSGEAPEEGDQGGAGQPTEGPITEGEAHRLFDSVEEGSQEHLVLPGAGEGKPW